jgi:hypothetical protein
LTAEQYKLSNVNVEIGESKSISDIYKIDELKSKVIIETENGYLILSELQ